MLLGMWVGSGKPPMSSYFAPLVKTDIAKFATKTASLDAFNGMTKTVQIIRPRFRVLCITADLPARVRWLCFPFLLSDSVPHLTVWFGKLGCIA